MDRLGDDIRVLHELDIMTSSLSRLKDLMKAYQSCGPHSQAANIQVQVGSSSAQPERGQNGQAPQPSPLRGQEDVCTATPSTVNAYQKAPPLPVYIPDSLVEEYKTLDPVIQKQMRRLAVAKHYSKFQRMKRFLKKRFFSGTS